MINKKFNHQGYSVIEILVGMIILGLTATIAATFLESGFKFFKVTGAKTEIQRDARTTISLMNQCLREAKYSGVTIDRFDSIQPFYSRIYFETFDGKQIYYYQNGRSLYQIVNGVTSILVKDNLKHLTFTYPDTSDPTIISISLCLEKATYAQQSKALQLSIEKVRLMNE